MLRSIKKWLQLQKQPVDNTIHISDSDHEWRDLSLSIKEMFASLPVENADDYEKLNIKEIED